MSLVTIISELWRFFKDNILRFIMGGIVFALLAVGLRYAISYFNSPESQEAVAYLEEVYQQEPAEFQAIVTLEDGDIFQNSYIFDEYFTKPEVIEQVEAETGVELSQWAESELILELFKTSQFRGGIAAIRDTSSGVITFRFLAAPTAEGNLAVAQAYADLLASGEIPFMANQNAEIVRQPEIIELLDVEETPEVASPETLDMYAGTGILSILIYALAGFIGGTLVTILFTFFMRIFKKRITYAFDYSWDFEDRQMIVNNSDLGDSIELQSLLSVPVVNRRVIISQGNLENIQEEILDEPDDDLIYVQKLQAIKVEDFEPNEIVIMVYSNQTYKDWYRTQYELAQLYQVPIRIIHVI